MLQKKLCSVISFEIPISDLPLDRVKAAEENEREDEAKDDDAWK